MNEQIVSQIKQHNEENTKSAIEIKEQIVNFLLFKMKDDVFAMESTLSREILRDLPVYSLPFVPTYVNGVLNRHGEPYTVIDPLLLIGKENQTENLFIVCQIPDEQLCLRVSDVIEFCEIEQNKINVFKNNESINFFKSSFLWKEKEVPVINIFTFLDKIKNDLKQL